MCLSNSLLIRPIIITYRLTLEGGLADGTSRHERVVKMSLSYGDLTRAALKKLCAQRNLEVSGTKDDMVARLEMGGRLAFQGDSPSPLEEALR
jgi:hypothetical protein